jgi:hypothetical protein
MQMSSSAKGNSISISISLVALSKDSLTSVTMWMNTVERSTPPPKHNTIPEKKDYKKTDSKGCAEKTPLR